MEQALCVGPLASPDPGWTPEKLSVFQEHKLNQPLAAEDGCVKRLRRVMRVGDCSKAAVLLFMSGIGSKSLIGDRNWKRVDVSFEDR